MFQCSNRSCPSELPSTGADENHFGSLAALALLGHFIQWYALVYSVVCNHSPAYRDRALAFPFAAAVIYH